jgi:hypothetical protein
VTYNCLTFPIQPGQPAKDFRLVAEEMVIVHNFLLRGINAIYLQCVNVQTQGTPKDVEDFSHYALEWAKLVHEHHHGEETRIFPDIEKLSGVPGLMGHNIEQHEAFTPGLEAYQKYLEAVVEGKEAYDGPKLRGIIDEFMPILREHLNDEIDTLLGLEKYLDKTDWYQWFARLQAEIIKKGSGDSQFKVGSRPNYQISLVSMDMTVQPVLTTEANIWSLSDNGDANGRLRP